MPDKLVLVTGASGYIAPNIIQQLLTEGYRVRGSELSLKDKERIDPLRKLAPGAKHQIELVEADLRSDDGWDEAVAGCWAVIHCASTLPNLTLNILEEDYMIPAVQGTLRVMQASAKAGIKKMVITGSAVAVRAITAPWADGREFTEEDWSDIDIPNIDFYSKSKIQMERTAWDFVKKLPDDKKMDLTVILPSFVLGPPLFKAQRSALSIKFMESHLCDWIPGSPYMHLLLCDVRDVALAHVKSLTTPGAVGKRILIYTESQWDNEVAKIVAAEFGPQGYRIFTNTLPYFIYWIASLFDKKLVEFGIPNNIGKKVFASNKRMKDILGIEPTPLKKTLLDMVYAMIDLGIIHKAKNYRKVGSRVRKLI